MYASAQYINIIGINKKLMCTFYFQTILVYLNVLMAYFIAKLKTNGDKASTCFKPSLIRNMSDKFAYLDSSIGFIHTHFISFTSFMSQPNSMRILYKTSLLTNHRLEVYK